MRKLLKNQGMAPTELKAAIDATVRRWMGWRIDRAEERATGMPRELSYLALLITAMAVEAEAA